MNYRWRSCIFCFEELAQPLLDPVRLTGCQATTTLLRSVRQTSCAVAFASLGRPPLGSAAQEERQPGLKTTQLRRDDWSFEDTAINTLGSFGKLSV
jgi:hypothetical protein